MDRIRDLYVLHGALDAPAWTIATCQRTLAVGLGPTAHAERGEAAYRVLLEIVTGLRSPVVGETNVAGQFRASWRAFADDPRTGSAARALAPIVDSLFADAASIRQRWLHGIGGSSYGTLARKLLKPRRGEQVLIVGTGALAASVLPAFEAWNPAQYARAATTAHRFHAGDEAAAIAWADCVVFCTPFGDDFRSRWHPAIVARPEVRVLHLGARDGDRSGTLTLDTLFALSAQLATARAAKVAAAIDACGLAARERCARSDGTRFRLTRSAVSASA